MTDTPFPPFMPMQPSPPTAPEQPAKQARKKKDPAPASETATVTEKAPRKKRALKAHSPRFDLQTTLAAAQSLNEADFPVFEKLVIMLDEYGKPGRERLLAAIGKVFA